MFVSSGVTAPYHGDMTQAGEGTSSDGEMGKDGSGNGDFGNGE